VAVVGGALGELHDGRDRGGELVSKGETSFPGTTCAADVMSPMNIEQSIDR
jgi:hypothetical protein